MTTRVIMFSNTFVNFLLLMVPLCSLILTQTVRSVLPMYCVLHLRHEMQYATLQCIGGFLKGDRIIDRTQLQLISQLYITFGQFTHFRQFFIPLSCQLYIHNLTIDTFYARFHAINLSFRFIYPGFWNFFLEKFLHFCRGYSKHRHI